MKLRTLPSRLPCLAAGWIAAGLQLLPCGASDHADPMNLLNPFEKQPDAEGNITDLHAFIADKDGKPVFRKPLSDDQLVISLCVRRALTAPDPAGKRLASDSSQLKLDAYTYRIHLDLNPEIGFFDMTKEDYDEKEQQLQAELKPAGDSLAELLEENKVLLEDPAAQEPPALTDARAKYKVKADALSAHVSATNRARANQDRYGGTFQKPEDINEDAGLQFTLHYNDTGKLETDSVILTSKVLTGSGWTGDRTFHDITEGGKSMEGQVNVQAGIFDDPFIFPRFFRRNVVGIVTMIPLDRLKMERPETDAHRPILLWATTHKGDKQIDHVGRSLRTQLPRFGYLNPLAPSKHMATIQRVQKQPTLIEDGFRTFVGPLFAHRNYDDVPDVMIYDLNRPAKFPNGRWLEDDVAKILADGGETLLFELSYAESEQYPRATENDKPFLPAFPFLASRWTKSQLGQSTEGSSFARTDGTWGVRPYDALGEVRADASFSPKTKTKLLVLAVLGVAATLIFLGAILALGFYLGRHRGLTEAGKPDDEGQGIQPGEEQAGGSCFAEMERALIDPATCLPYRNPMDPVTKPLPRHGVSFWKIASGILPWGKPSLLQAATRRTVAVRTDLRWGKDRKGVQRLIHPNGVCLSGRWVIKGIKQDDGSYAETGYSGWFEKDKVGLVIARWSPARAETRRGNWRSHGLVGKIYPTADKNDRVTKSASFITQEDLGGMKVNSIREMEFRNGPDLHSWRRGKGFFALLLSGLVFARVNVNAVIRQLHEIAELTPEGHEPVAKPSCPTFMRFRVISEHESDAADVRDEILEHIYKDKYPVPQHELILSIEVSDSPQDIPDAGPLTPKIERNIPEEDWKLIGQLIFDRAACGYNGDFVVHFHHPVWRSDRHDPKSESKPL